jgi:hypothetical protein
MMSSTGVKTSKQNIPYSKVCKNGNFLDLRCEQYKIRSLDLSEFFNFYVGWNTNYF